MKCRCGHGRGTHAPTAKGMKMLRERQAHARYLRIVRPDHLHLPCRTCKCRDWHPEEDKV